MNTIILNNLLNIQLINIMSTPELFNVVLLQNDSMLNEEKDMLNKKVIINGDNNRNILFNVIDGGKYRLKSILFLQPKIA